MKKATAVDRLFKPWVEVYTWEDNKTIAYVQVTKDMFMVDPRTKDRDPMIQMIQPTEAGWKHMGFFEHELARHTFPKEGTRVIYIDSPKRWMFVDEPEKPPVVRTLDGDQLRWTFDGTDWKLG